MKANSIHNALSRSGRIILLLAAFCFHFSNLSLLHAEMRDSVSLEQIVVTGTRTMKPLKDTPIETRLITSRDIEQSDATNVQELLTRMLPGVEFSYAMNQQTHLNFSGFGGQSILFLLDGDRIAGETMDDVDFTRLSLDNVDHIEIIKGASSALYGSNAAGGVINIITKTPTKRWASRVHGRYGTYNNARYGISYGRYYEKVQNTLCFTGTHIDSYNVSNGNKAFAQTPYMVDTYYGGKTYNINDKMSITLPSGWISEEAKLRLILKAGYFFREKATASPTLPDHYRGLNLGARTLWNLNDRDNIELAYNFDQYDKAQHSTLTDLCLRTYSNVQNSTRALYNHTLSNRNILTVGADYMRDYLLNSKTANGEYVQHSIDAFAQFDWNISDKWEMLTALRYDYLSDGRHHRLSPKLNVRYKASDRLTLRGGYGMGFRAPTLKEKYYIFNMAGIWDIVGSKVVGYDLKPEESHNFNLSAQYIVDGYVINGAAYYNIIRNRITTGMPYDKSVFPGDPSSLGTTRWMPYVNVKRYNSLSLDLSLQKHWSQGISAMLAYAFIHEDAVKDADGNEMNGQYLPARPHSVTANIDWDKQFSKNYGLNIAINGRFMSAVDNTEYVDYTTTDPTTGKLLRTNVHYGAYTLWQLIVTQRIYKAFKLSVTLDNIFNYKPTYHYFNSPFTDGTTIQAGLSIDLDML